MASSAQYDEISSQQITIAKAKLLVDKECLTHELKLMTDQCEKMSLKIDEQSKEINMLKRECTKRLRDVSKAEDSLQKQTVILTTLQEFLDTLVDKMNEYEERRVSRDAQIESTFNDFDHFTSTHKSEMAESMETIKSLENQLQLKTNELDEFQRNLNLLQLQFDEVNEELQSVLVKVVEQNELKTKIDCLSEEKEDMIKTISNLEDERTFLQEKNETLIQNEKKLQDSVKECQTKSFQDSEELKRQIIDLMKLKEELDSNNSNLNIQINDLRSQMNDIQLELNESVNALKEENLKLTKDLEETLANNTSYESAIKAELEDERQNLIRVKLHNDTLENQIYDLTKQNTEFQTKMLNLRELNLELTEKLKNTEDVQNFKRPAGPTKRSIPFDPSEIVFTTPESNPSSKKPKQGTDKPILMRRPQRNLSTDSDFSIGDETPETTPETIKMANRGKVIKKQNTFFSQQVPRSQKQIDEAMDTYSIDSSSSRNGSAE